METPENLSGVGLNFDPKLFAAHWAILQATDLCAQANLGTWLMGLALMVAEAELASQCADTEARLHWAGIVRDRGRRPDPKYSWRCCTGTDTPSAVKKNRKILDAAGGVYGGNGDWYFTRLSYWNIQSRIVNHPEWVLTKIPPATVAEYTAWIVNRFKAAVSAAEKALADEKDPEVQAVKAFMACAVKVLEQPANKPSDADRDVPEGQKTQYVNTWERAWFHGNHAAHTDCQMRTMAGYLGELGILDQLETPRKSPPC